MPLPSYCRNRRCPNYDCPPPGWYRKYGTYKTAAHGQVQRYQCKRCGATCSTQTESLHYYAKRRIPFEVVRKALSGGASMREIAVQRGLSPVAVFNGVIRLGRQSMAAHLMMLHSLEPRATLVVDGLRTFVTSQDYPCDMTTAIDKKGEVILSIVHSIFTRGGRTTDKQRERLEKKLAVWRPKRGGMRRDILLLIKELWDYLRPTVANAAVLDTDKHPLYAACLKEHQVTEFFRSLGLFTHRRTPSTAPRTVDNPLFAANYIDRLIRHRVREHFRETIAFGRNAVAQMHRMWIFAFDHNCRRDYRVKHPEEGVHAEQGAVRPAVIAALNREFYTRRIRLRGIDVPTSIHRVWTGTLPTPPHLWKKGQKGTAIHFPAFALRDLAA